ncbi:MAG: hypothetical protein AB3X44_07985 [Leptothrix sp. (in: b-proteobacteria)]
MSSTSLVSAAAPRLAMHQASMVAALRSVPGQLWLRQALIVIAAVLVTLTGLRSYQLFTQVAQTLGRDAVPSIVAAEQIRTRLADAHTQLMNVFLTREAEGPAMQAYRQTIAQAHDHLLTASQNITYGDDERGPILTTMTLLSDYERLVGRALTIVDYSAALGQADALMRGRILPAVAALDQANFKHLDVAWQDQKARAHAWLAGFIATAVLLVAVLIETQLKLYATFRRIVNPALALALVAVVVVSLSFTVTALRTIEEIRSAKEDAFDSVHALSQAEALAFTANAHESIFLLLHGRSEQVLQADLFHAAAAHMFSAQLPPDGRLPADLKTLKGTGLMGDELANITYDGEAPLATTELQRWLDYVRIDAQIRALEAAGQHAEAVALCLGTQPEQSDWAFERFITALRATLQLNQDQFASTMARAYADAHRLGLLLIALLLVPLLGSVIGLRARLAEFRA